jgi:hypothetical protein
VNAIKGKRPATNLLVVALILAGTQLVTSSQAKADTLVTFDNLTPSSSLVEEGPQPFSDQGLTFAIGQYLYLEEGANYSGGGANNGTNFVTGGYVATAARPNLIVTLTGGGAFDLQSIDLGLGQFTSPTDTVTITGYLNGTAVATDTVTLNQSFQTVILPTAFGDISSATFVLADNSNQLSGDGGYLSADNIDYSTGSSSDPSPTPEPSSLLLLGTGLAGLAAVGFKRSSLMPGLGN